MIIDDEARKYIESKAFEIVNSVNSELSPIEHSSFEFEVLLSEVYQRGYQAGTKQSPTVRDELHKIAEELAKTISETFKGDLFKDATKLSETIAMLKQAVLDLNGRITNTDKYITESTMVFANRTRALSQFIKDHVTANVDPRSYFDF